MSEDRCYCCGGGVVEGTGEALLYSHTASYSIWKCYFCGAKWCLYKGELLVCFRHSKSDSDIWHSAGTLGIWEEEEVK